MGSRHLSKNEEQGENHMFFWEKNIPEKGKEEQRSWGWWVLGVYKAQQKAPCVPECVQGSTMGDRSKQRPGLHHPGPSRALAVTQNERTAVEGWGQRRATGDLGF